MLPPAAQGPNMKAAFALLAVLGLAATAAAGEVRWVRGQALGARPWTARCALAAEEGVPAPSVPHCVHRGAP